MMHMTFYWGKTVTLLVDQWFVNSWLGYLLSLAAVLVIGIFHEWLTSQRTSLSKSLESKASEYLASHEEQGRTLPLIGQVRAPSASQAQKASEALLYTISAAIGYLLMLAVMSYNGGVFIAIVLGLGLGFYIFRAGTSSAGSSDVCAAT